MPHLGLEASLIQVLNEGPELLDSLRRRWHFCQFNRTEQWRAQPERRTDVFELIMDHPIDSVVVSFKMIETGEQNHPSTDDGECRTNEGKR